MKAIVNGKRYDTETATKVARWWNGLPYSDFGVVTETLYMTKKGAWFLHGDGGALSAYSRPCGNNARCGGDRIVPLSMEEALAWCERHDQTEAAETHLASLVEDA